HSDLHPDAQPRRRRARVRGRLASARSNRLAREGAQLRLLAAHAHRKVGWTFAAAFEVAHEALDDAILERVEADHRKPAARPEHRERGGKGGLERAELVVDRDAERLEDAFCGMAVAEARGGRNGRLDRLDEVARPLEGFLPAATDDRARDLLRV